MQPAFNKKSPWVADSDTAVKILLQFILGKGPPFLRYLSIFAKHPILTAMVDYPKLFAAQEHPRHALEGNT